MSARQDISGFLERWRRLTEAEGEAIQKGAWPAVEEIQASKAGLRKNLAGALERWTAEGAETKGKRQAGDMFRAEVNRLLSLEIRNQELLAARRARLRQERDSLNQAARTLRKVRGLYVGRPDDGWSSYS